MKELIELAKEKLKPGVLPVEVDKVAREYIVSQGYGEFPHGLGHQVGRFVHDGNALLGPAWEKYANKPFETIEEDMVFTIEPMINMGGAASKVLGDGWTVITRDHSLSAQFEHTMAVTRDGVEILTLSKAERADAVSELSHETDSRA